MPQTNLPRQLSKLSLAALSWPSIWLLVFALWAPADGIGQDPLSAEGVSEVVPAELSLDAETATSAEVGGQGTGLAEGQSNGPVLALGDTNRPLHFSFSGARWREVIQWLADAGDLALYLGELPQGTFTYVDSKQYSIDEAISRLNLFLIADGFVIVRSGKLLTLIQLGDPRSLQRLELLATQVSPEDLNVLEPHQLVRCYVPLGEVPSEDAVAELQLLSLLAPPKVLPKSNQLVVIETVEKLRSVVAVLEAMKEVPSEEPLLRRFDLKHLTAETVLFVAGQHLGIPPGETQGLDITITTDFSGQSLFAFGNPEKVEKLALLLESLDVPEGGGESDQAFSLVSYPVPNGNLQTVYDVLQTVLAGESLRLSADTNVQRIIAFASPSVHKTIRDTIDELEAPGMEFAVIDLGGADPYFAVALIEELFANEVSSNRGDDRDRQRTDGLVSGPKVDADPADGKLFVRGTSDQVQQIRAVVEQISKKSASRERARLLPVTEEGREQVQAVIQRWLREERGVDVVLPMEGKSQEIIERTLHDVKDGATFDKDARGFSSENTTLTAAAGTSGDVASFREDAGGNPERHGKPQVMIQNVPAGLIVSSDDPGLLDEVEQAFSAMTGFSKRSVSPPVIFYLKYVPAGEAVQLLADLIDGELSLSSAAQGDLVQGSVYGSSSSSYYGSFIMSRDGAKTMTAGTSTVIADERLNRLIVQGLAGDVDRIERYLRVIDKESSITNIETSGQTHLIPLQHTKAENVANMIREAFPDRVLSANLQNNRDRGRPGEPQRREAESSQGDARDRRGDEGSPPSQPPIAERPVQGRLPKMAVAVHQSSNSIVITAPQSLFDRVKELVERVDAESEQVVEVITPAEGVEMGSVFRMLSGGDVSFSRSDSRSSSGRSTSSSSSRREEGSRGR